MSIILQPQVSFPIVRQIANHTDSSTYYVRAVVRDANGDTIDTVDLASQGSQRYQTSWAVPTDPSGMGRYISIVTSVYEDSGYTTKSVNYGDEETTYLIFNRVTPAMRGGGGVDSRTIRRIIQEELDKRQVEEPEDDTEPKDEPEMRWDEVLTAINGLTARIDAIPQPEPVSLKPIATEIKALTKAVKAIKTTPETDLDPVMGALEAMSDQLAEPTEDLSPYFTDIKSQLHTLHAELVSLHGCLHPSPAHEKQETKERLYDISKLTK